MMSHSKTVNFQFFHKEKNKINILQIALFLAISNHYLFITEVWCETKCEWKNLVCFTLNEFLPSKLHFTENAMRMTVKKSTAKVEQHKCMCNFQIANLF